MTMMNETAFPRGRRPREEKEDVASPPGMKRKHEPKAEKDDYLFGVDKSSSKKKKKRKAADAASGSSFALPLGGGFVQAGKGKDKGATIEALSFAKLSKGTKLLGIVREVQDDFCLVALPNLLTGYVLPKPEVSFRSRVMILLSCCLNNELTHLDLCCKRSRINLLSLNNSQRAKSCQCMFSKLHQKQSARASTR